MDVSVSIVFYFLCKRFSARVKVLKIPFEILFYARAIVFIVNISISRARELSRVKRRSETDELCIVFLTRTCTYIITGQTRVL